MAAPSLQTLQRLATDTGYQPGTLEKVLHLIDLLEEIAGDTFLRDRLALKGGTALNVFHLELDRLSVDIDLNYIGSLDRDVMLADRPQIEEALQRILAAGGYRVRRLPEEHAGGKWIASYTSALGGCRFRRKPPPRNGMISPPCNEMIPPPDYEMMPPPVTE